MEYKDGDIIRYVKVASAFNNSSWYCDLDDEIEKGDTVIVPYMRKETEGIVSQVVRCVYPYVVFPIKKTLPVLELVKKAEQ
ncbi:MAG: hypothetical protein J6D52_00830 [Clostridia bacterium]|nr:hypothetical protein [Clostridia bacterium]